MTPYRVEWETEADDRLAEIWTNAKDRAAITRAAHEIDRMLTRAPKTSAWRFPKVCAESQSAR